ncbi:unnamed protein product [Ilex paraguariensis]|uniref:Uncharacterized protein n=1 Tax=Ilex paraguariensis TaxID=185542 RepID=A0ABC8S8B4_9AQUA
MSSEGEEMRRSTGIHGDGATDTATSGQELVGVVVTEGGIGEVRCHGGVGEPEGSTNTDLIHMDPGGGSLSACPGREDERRHHRRNPTCAADRGGHGHRWRDVPIVERASKMRRRSRKPRRHGSTPRAKHHGRRAATRGVMLDNEHKQRSLQLGSPDIGYDKTLGEPGLTAMTEHKARKFVSVVIE